MSSIKQNADFHSSVSPEKQLVGKMINWDFLWTSTCYFVIICVSVIEQSLFCKNYIGLPT
jgi:hypothetical protein